ncbi:glycine betaine ABC transporter substrate-binding protein, partial [Rhizobium ruizarguesonis]
EKGQPDIAPEAWIDLLPDFVKKGTDEGRIVQVGSPLPDGGVQGCWIPKYLADAHPDIKTIGALLRILRSGEEFRMLQHVADG